MGKQALYFRGKIESMKNILLGVLGIALFSLLSIPMSSDKSFSEWTLPSLYEFVFVFGSLVFLIAITLIVLWVAFGVLEYKKFKDIEDAYGKVAWYCENCKTYHDQQSMMCPYCGHAR